MTFDEWWVNWSGEFSIKELTEAAWEVAFEEGYKFANKENEDYDKIGV